LDLRDPSIAVRKICLVVVLIQSVIMPMYNGTSSSKLTDDLLDYLYFNTVYLLHIYCLLETQ
jgi:hypothetical protein